MGTWEDFTGNPNRYRVNTDICSRFVASLLDYGQSGLLATHLTQALFPLDYLGGLEDLVAYHVPFLGLPMASNLERFIFQNEEVRWCPFINGLKTMSFSSHRYCAELAAESLLWVHMMVPIPKGMEWYTSFRDYIFPRFLLTNQPPNLVVIFKHGEPESSSSSEWLGDEGDSDTEEEDTETSLWEVLAKHDLHLKL